VRGKNERHCSSHRGPRARPQMFSLGLAPISQVCTPNPTRRHEKRDAIFFLNSWLSMSEDANSAPRPRHSAEEMQRRGALQMPWMFLELRRPS